MTYSQLVNFLSGRYRGTKAFSLSADLLQFSSGKQELTWRLWVQGADDMIKAPTINGILAKLEEVDPNPAYEIIDVT